MHPLGPPSLTNRRFPILSALRFFFVFGTAGLVLVFGHRLLSPDLAPAISLAVFLWLFATVVVGALMVVSHADELAVILGEPYGTLILTLSVGSGRTNVLQGTVHLGLFLAFILLIFIP